MASWFTVYCTRSVQHVTTAELTAALGPARVDFYTLAEGFGIDDESGVERAIAALNVEPAEGTLGERFRIRYRPAKYRGLMVYLWATPERVRTELSEAHEQHLDGRRGQGVSQIRAALSGVTEVVGIELGLNQLADMGLVIAGQVAEHLCSVSAGLIRDTNDEWWTVRRGVPKLILGQR